MPDLTGQILGKYRIVRVLGRGGMGTVYLAEQATFQRTVALKVVTSENLRSPDAVRRFGREIQAAARLEHPNIVAAYDADEVDGVCFLVMEYVEGHDLRGLVAEGGPLPVAQAVDYMRQAAAGLAYAHARGIIHRDIKPANLLLGPGGTVKVLDMGLALVLSADHHDPDSPAVSELTHTGAVMGTVDYMSPEQALDTHATDARGDVYSLGCTLYFLLTGTAPYRGNTLMARMLAHREGEIPSLAAARADVSPQLDAVFRRMIAKAPADRFQTMDELLAALRQVASPPAGGRRVPVSAAALNGGPLSQGETAGLGKALGVGADITAAEPFEFHSRRHQQKRSPAVIVAAAGLVSALAIGGYFLMDRAPKGRPTTKAASAPADPRSAPNRAAPTAEPEDAGDRPVAEWVLQSGGSIELRLGEGTFTPQTLAELPLAPFRLTRVTINGHRYAAGDLERLADLPELIHLELAGSWQGGTALIPDSDLQFVQRLPRLESISLHFLTISDGALTHLAKLERLTSVSLYHSAGIGDDGVAHLRGLHRLHSLHLGGTSVTDAVFEFLEGMPELENLLLDDTRVTGTGMTHLLPAKKLQWIHLANSQLNDAGLAALANIKWLPTLSITNTQVTDAGLKSLLALERLETLNLEAMPHITDAGIGHLAGLKELRRLALNGDGVTDAGVAALQARLPDCRIER